MAQTEVTVDDPEDYLQDNPHASARMNFISGGTVMTEVTLPCLSPPATSGEPVWQFVNPGMDWILPVILLMEDLTEPI